MVIDVLKLKHSGKTELDFYFEHEVEDNLLLIPDAVIENPIKVSGALELHGDDVYIDGEINCKIVGKCARCLEEAKCDFTENFSVKYVRFNPDENEGEYLYKKGVVDLRYAVNEILTISAQPVIYCKDNCKGLCPLCGSNLNEKDCGCKN